jgi:heptosyltransferase II
MALCIKILAFLLSRMPYEILEFATKFLGLLFVAAPSKRRRILLSNLKRAFPDWPLEKIISVAKESSARMFEMGFFSLCYPLFTRNQLKQTILYPKETDNKLDEIRKSGSPLLILTPHVCLFETLATSPYFRPRRGRTLGAIYRPNKNPKLDNWINAARTKMGLKTFARKEGLLKARDHLRKGNWLIVLFDQNAGLQGNMTFFLDRLASITSLPDSLMKSCKGRVIFAMPRRASFFRSRLECIEINRTKGNQVSMEAHLKLENAIRSDPMGLPEWLWSHGKWKTQDNAHSIFHINSKRKFLGEKIKLKKKTKVWIRMPNWLGDVIMAIPIIKAIERGRSDAEITVICQNQFSGLLKHLGVGHRYKDLPDKGRGYFMRFLPWRREYPDVHLLFTNSIRGDLEAYICGAPLRLGGSMGRKRHLLSHQSFVNKEFRNKHQLDLWIEYAKFFGLRESVDLSPIFRRSKAKAKSRIICLAPGSSNSPEKRWPVENWINLLLSLSNELAEYEFNLIGTAKDSAICNAIRKHVNSDNIHDFSGKTNLVELCDLLSDSNVLICNDSGAMHLANALGIETVALFGPTDPKRTGPVFKTINEIIKQSFNGNCSSLNSTLQATLSILKRQENTASQHSIDHT